MPATALLASAKIWRTATVGGNICLSFPAGAMISLISALDGTVTVWRADGPDHVLPITDFVTGDSRNVLQPGDLLRSVHLPAHALTARTAYRKLAPSPLGRSSAVVIGRRHADGEFVVSVTAATVRPMVFRFDALPSATALRDALGAIAEQDITRDVHGDPDWRRAVTMMPPSSSATPGMAPGVSTTNTSGRLNESQNRMKPAALSDASLPTAPDMCIGWLAITPTGRPSTRANAVIIEGLR